GCSGPARTGSWPRRSWLAPLLISFKPATDPPELVVFLTRTGDRLPLSRQAIELPLLHRFSDNPVHVGLGVMAEKDSLPTFGALVICLPLSHRGCYPRLAVRLISTFPASAFETGQFSFATSASSLNFSSEMPSTMP